MKKPRALADVGLLLAGTPTCGVGFTGCYYTSNFDDTYPDRAFTRLRQGLLIGALGRQRVKTYGGPRAGYVAAAKNQ